MTDQTGDMNAVVIDRPGAIALRRVEIPAAQGDDVLVRVEACGVCGTDFHIFGGHVPDVTFPIIAGHEAVGTVVATGELVEDDLVGLRVVVEGKAGTGFTRDGAYAEYLTVPRSQVTPVPDNLDAVDATLIDPLACAIHAVHRANVGDGARVVVVGQGSSGLCVLQALKALTTAQVAVVDRHDDRLELARQFGADLALHSERDDVPARIRDWTGGELADRAIEVTGKAGGAQIALSTVRPEGRMVVYGVFDGLVPLDLTAVTLGEIEIAGAVGSPGTYPLAVELAGAGRVNLTPIISRIISLDEIPSFFAPSGDGAAERKAVVTFG